MKILINEINVALMSTASHADCQKFDICCYLRLSVFIQENVFSSIQSYWCDS